MLQLSDRTLFPQVRSQARSAAECRFAPLPGTPWHTANQPLGFLSPTVLPKRAFQTFFAALFCLALCVALSSNQVRAAQDFDVRAADSLWKIPRYPSDELWEPLQPSLSLTLARGESESGQVALQARQDMELMDLKAELTPLRHTTTDQPLLASREPIYMVAYLNPLKPNPEDGMWPAVPPLLDQPDPLVPVPDRVGLKAGETLTLWVTIIAPRDTEPGRYAGELQITWRGLAKPVSVPVEAEVWNVTLPTNTQIQTQLFSLNLGQVAQYAGVVPRADNPAWMKVVERCVDLFRHYRISPGQAAFLGLGSQPLPVPGRCGHAGRFDGHVTQFQVSLPEGLPDASEFTVMGWVRPQEGDARSQFVWSSWQQGQGFRLEYREGQHIVWYQRRQEPTAWQGQMEASLPAGQWGHIAVVRSGDTTRLYVDGEPQAEMASSPKPILYSTLLLGTYPYMNSSLFNGDLDEFRVFDRVLDQETIHREMEGPAEESEAIVKESFENLPPGSFSVYTDEGAELLQAWWQFWRSEGLHLGNVTAPGAYKYNRMDFRTTEAFFSRIYPWLQEREWLPYTYTRMPVDEALTGRGWEVNTSYGQWLGEHFPDLNRHHTIGDAIEDKALEELKQYAGAIDIWDFTPGMWQHRGHQAMAYLDQRRAEHGDRIAWYLTRSSPVSRSSAPLQPLDLRGFFWQMMKFDVRMVNHWAVNVWDYPSGKHAQRDLQWFEAERCYKFRPSTAAGVASATFLWPSPGGPLPSIRWATLRDGIEDFDLWFLVRQGGEEARKQGVAIAELDEVLTWVGNAPLRFVGLLGFSTEFGRLEQFLHHRAQMARVAVRLDEAGLLPKPETIPNPPGKQPWRWFIELK